MNIPENILQQVADAAFAAQGRIIIVSCPDPNNIWNEQATSRRAVIQHALDNPALAPCLAGGIGEYTDMEIADAWRSANHTIPFVSEIKRFLSSLPRRESPAFAEAIARAEKAEAELSGLLEAANEESRKDHVKYSQLANKLEGAQAELAALKSAELGILRPLSEMPETVPDGCVILYGNLDKQLPFCFVKTSVDTHFAILRLPAAEASPQAQADPYAELKAAHASGKVIQRDLNADADNEDWRDENPDWKSHPTCYRIKPEPAAQVPLGPEDCPPGSVLKALSWEEYEWRSVSHVYSEGVLLDNCPTTHSWIELEANWQINTSLSDTGRWDANAWRPCSKPGKEVAK